MSIYDGYSLLKWQLLGKTPSIQNRTLYYLRAIDSGLTAPGYVYWYNYTGDYTNAPIPNGTLSNKQIIITKDVDYILWS